MTLEHFLAAWIVGSSLVSAAVSITIGVVFLHKFMDEADARERRRKGHRHEAGMDGVEIGSRLAEPDRAAALRVFRETGWMSANQARRYWR